MMHYNIVSIVVHSCETYQTIMAKSIYYYMGGLCTVVPIAIDMQQKMDCNIDGSQ